MGIDLVKDDIIKVTTAFFEKPYIVERVPCLFDGKNFYDAAIVKTPNCSYFVKMETDYKGINHLKYEYEINKFLYNNNISVPKPIMLFEGSSEVTRQLAFYEALDAENFTKNHFFKKDNVVAIATIVRNLHQLVIDDNVPIRHFGSLDPLDDFLIQFLKKKQKLVGYGSSFGRYDNEKLNIIEEKYRILLSYIPRNIPYGLCKKDLNKNNRMQGKKGIIYSIDHEFVQYAPLAFDMYELQTNLFVNNSQQELFIDTYGRELYKNIANENVMSLVSILKALSLLITYHKSQNKDVFLLKRSKLIFDNFI